MAGGRLPRLIRQAAFKKVIDFSKAKVLDRQWCDYFRRRIEDLEESNFHEYGKISLLSQAVRVIRSSDEHAPKAFEKLQGEVRAVFDYYFPWAAETTKKSREVENTKLRDSWIREFGDPDDPAVQAAIEATVRSLAI